MLLLSNLFYLRCELRSFYLFELPPCVKTSDAISLSSDFAVCCRFRTKRLGYRLHVSCHCIRGSVRSPQVCRLPLPLIEIHAA